MCLLTLLMKSVTPTLLSGHLRVLNWAMFSPTSTHDSTKTIQCFILKFTVSSATLYYLYMEWVFELIYMFEPEHDKKKRNGIYAERGQFNHDQSSLSRFFCAL